MFKRKRKKKKSCTFLFWTQEDGQTQQISWRLPGISLRDGNHKTVLLKKGYLEGVGGEG